MILESVHLSRCSWGIDKGKLEGAINVTTFNGEIKLKLTEDQCNEILNLLSVALVKQVKQIAEGMCAQVIDGTKQLVDDSKDTEDG